MFPFPPNEVPRDRNPSKIHYVPIYCVHCGHHIGAVDAKVEGKQIIGCEVCKRARRFAKSCVKVKSGRVNVYW